LSFDLKVGFTCNNNCVHCVITDKKQVKDLTTEEIKDIIKKLEKTNICFTGGEATIREDFIELIKFAKMNGHRVSLQTNGTTFSDEEFTKEASKYLDGVLIAIHSCIKEVHDKIVQGNGMYEKTIEGFKNIIKYNINCGTQTVISKLNISSILQTYDFIQKIKPGIRMNLTFPHPNGNAYYNHDIVVPRFSDISMYLKEILKKHHKLINTEAIPMCYLYPYHNEVNNVDNELRKSIKRSGLDPSNKNSKFFDKDGITNDYNLSGLSEKRKGFKCCECILNNECVGVWKEYLEFYEKNLDLYPMKNTRDEKCTRCGESLNGVRAKFSLHVKVDRIRNETLERIPNLDNQSFEMLCKKCFNEFSNLMKQEI